MHTIMKLQKIITATKRQDTIYNRIQNIKVIKFFLSVSHRDNLNKLSGV